MVDDQVVADSGPQVFTRTSEDHHNEHTDTLGGNTNRDQSVIELDGSQLDSRPVVGEKSDIRDLLVEKRKECFQYHSEDVKELSGPEVVDMLRREPSKLFEPIEEEIDEDKKNSSLLQSYSNVAKKIAKRDKVNEVSRLGADGVIYTETTKSTQVEEVDEDELPEIEHEQRKQLPSHNHAKNSRLAIGYQPIEVNNNQDSWIDNYNHRPQSNASSGLGGRRRYLITSIFDDVSRPLGNRSYSTLPKNSKICHKKEDASVQASFSDSDSEQSVSR